MTDIFIRFWKYQNIGLAVNGVWTEAGDISSFTNGLVLGGLHPRRRHKMETFNALLTLCEGNPPVVPLTKPVTRSFDVFFKVCLSKLLNKQSKGRWFQMSWCSFDVTVMRYSEPIYDSFIAWEIFPHYWPFMCRIHGFYLVFDQQCGAFYIFYVVELNKSLNKQHSCRRFKKSWLSGLLKSPTTVLFVQQL